MLLPMSVINACSVSYFGILTKTLICGAIDVIYTTKVKCVQRSGTDNIQHTKPKREITNITNSQNTKENIWSTEGAAISQKVVTQQPKPN